MFSALLCKIRGYRLPIKKPRRTQNLQFYTTLHFCITLVAGIIFPLLR